MIRKITMPENDLVFLLKNKDPKGFDILYNNYSRTLYGSLLKVVQSPENASDLLQDAFLKVWKNIDKFDSSKGSLFTWMFNISRNLAIDQVRSAEYKKTISNLNLADNLYRVEEEYNVHMHVDGIGLKKVVEMLPPKYKLIIELLYFKGYSQTEASQELGIPVGTVKTHIRTAISQLRDLMCVY